MHAHTQCRHASTYACMHIMHMHARTKASRVLRSRRHMSTRALLTACANGDAERAHELLISRPPPAGSARLQAALHAACEEGHVECAALLLHAGATAAATAWRADDGSTALQAAAAGGYAPLVKLLLRAGAGPDPQSLGLAIGSRCRSAVSALLRAGASPSTTKGDSGWSPLLAAVAVGDASVTRMLLRRHGVAATALHGPTGLTALHVACDVGAYDCARLVLIAGGFTMDKARFTLECSDASCTPLQLALAGESEGHAACVALLEETRERRCAVCGAGEAAGRRLLGCNGCKSSSGGRGDCPFYCCREHQRLHWSTHCRACAGAASRPAVDKGRRAALVEIAGCNGGHATGVAGR